MADAWYIREWRKRYEVDENARPARPGATLRAGGLPWIRLKVNGHKKGAGYRRLEAVAGSAVRLEGAFALFIKLLELAGDSPAELRGWVLDERDRPANIDDLVFFTGFRRATVERGLEVLSDPRVAWIERRDSAEIRRERRKSATDGDGERDGEGEREKKIPPGFDAFWKAYPNPAGRKKARPQCLAKWKELRLESRADQILAALERWKTSKAWAKERGAFVPGPHPWLHQACFEEKPPQVDGTGEAQVSPEQQKKDQEASAKHLAEQNEIIRDQKAMDVWWAKQPTAWKAKQKDTDKRRGFATEHTTKLRCWKQHKETQT